MPTDQSRWLTGEIQGVRLFVVKATSAEGVKLLRNVIKRYSDSYDSPQDRDQTQDQLKVEPDDDGDGPNHRGTYSKAYTMLHPEIKWVHRGQGRYLPAATAHALQMQTPIRESRRIDPSARTPPQQQQPSRSLRHRRSSLTAEEEDTKDRTLSLRRRSTNTQLAADTNARSSRLSRHAKPEPSHDSGRRSSRISTQVDYDEYSDDSDSDDMAGDKETTYDKEYVDAHPNEQFYHTGNGWYKRGRRPRERKNVKKREAEGHAKARTKDGKFIFNPNTTIHVSQLELYPGVEFHHCGNGWYRAGPDASGLRASRFGGPVDLDDDEEQEEEAEAEDDEEEDGGDDEVPSGIDDTVSKAYTLRHPDVEWIHRGKGRYKRKSVVNTGNATPTSVEPEQDTRIYSKAYVEAHPNEVFHHRGNARYMRGEAPDHWQNVRRKKKVQPPPPPPEIVPIDHTKLYDKAFVEAHPHLEFHHRGQGRYARGPRKPATPVLEQEEESESESEPEIDTRVLVDRAYVNAHPHETFHHRGQGRWARGMPPPGTSNKVAIRGPGANDRMTGSRGETQERDEGPPLTSLFNKADGPEKWPHLEWHYRGGGKWARISKAQFEDMQRDVLKRQYAKPKARGRRDMSAALIDRESAAAEAAHHLAANAYGSPGNMVDGAFSEKPKPKRRRLGKRGSYQLQDDGTGTKQSSHSQSQAPTPKPRMLEPDEDILEDEDLPQLYRDDWSPPTEYIADPAERLDRNMPPLTNPDAFVRSLTKFDPMTRSLPNLYRLAANAQRALDQLQAEYLALDRITAPHARIPRKPARGGRVPVEHQVFEDRKEADLYDYSYDPRRLGYQDPEAQKIQRDAEGRELRNRRNRSGATMGTLPGWNFGEDEPLGPRRAVKPVNRFDGIVDQPRKRARGSAMASKVPTPSMTPDRAVTPLGGPVRMPVAGLGRGRLMGNVPRRIQELRGESVGPVNGGGKGVDQKGGHEDDREMDVVNGVEGAGAEKGGMEKV